VCTHRACVRTALINEISTGPGSEVSSGCCRDIPSGDLGVRSVLPVPLAARDVAIQSRRYGVRGRRSRFSARPPRRTGLRRLLE